MPSCSACPPPISRSGSSTSDGALMDDTFDYGGDIFEDAPEPVSVAILGSTGSSGTTLIDGSLASAEVAEAADASVVLNAVVGAAGLRATLATLSAGKILAL